MTKKITQKEIEKLIVFAKQFIDIPYKYGATKDDAPNFFDCSGFIQYVFEHFGYTIPRSTIDQAEAIKRTIKDIKKIIPGDLIFLHGEKGHYNKKFPQGIGHVVMFLGDNKIIHATSKRISQKPIKEVGGVQIDNLNRRIKKDTIVIIKRLI